MERAQKIIKEAVEQSHKHYLPQVVAPVQLMELVSEYETGSETLKQGEIFYLDIEASKLILSQVNVSLNKNNNPRQLHVFIGPEGGWGDADRKQLERLGAKPISLGHNVLRAETAAITISALILLPN
jgi:16S rRNA (uracil1498-N3)-methyltransferase